MPKNKPWTQDEIDYLLANKSDKTHSELGKDLNRSRISVKSKCQRLRADRNEKPETNMPGGEFKNHTIKDVIDGNYRIITASTIRIKDVNHLLKVCNVDRDEWEIDGKYEVGSWEMGRRAEIKKMQWNEGKIIDGESEDSGKLYITTLFRYKVPLIRKVPIAITPVVQPVTVKISHLNLPKITGKGGKALLIPDMQIGYRRNYETGELVPYHCRQSMSIILQVASKQKFDAVIYLGDALDLAEWTDKYVKSPEFFYTTQPAFIECSWFMGQMKQLQPKAKHVFLLGNHENRFENYIMTHWQAGHKLKPATEMILDEPMSIKRMLGLDGLGIEISAPYPNGQVWLNGLRCVHGSLISANAGKTAEKIVARATYTTAFGHPHRIESATKTQDDKDGLRYVMAASFGCLCKIDYTVPGHKRGQNWQNGFGIAHMGKNVRLEAIPIFEYEAIYNGGIIKGFDYLPQLKRDTTYKF